MSKLLRSFFTQCENVVFIFINFIRSTANIWAKYWEVNEDECCIHQFGATFKRSNQIKNTKKRLPKDIFDSVENLNSSTMSDLACALYKKPPIEEALEISIELINIACDFNSLAAFALLCLETLTNIEKEWKRIKLLLLFITKLLPLVHKNSIFAYAKILTGFSTKKIGIKKRKRLLKEGRESIFILDGKNSHFYEEARICFDTIEDCEMSLYVAKKYFEKASKKGHAKSANILKNLCNIDYPQPYFEELH